MKVAVVDYGLGNIQSMMEAIRYIGFEPVLDTDGSRVQHAGVIVIPGVAEFSTGIKNLCNRGLDDSLRRSGSRGQPIVGVCLGAQLLLEGSEESPEVPGLGLVSGRAVALNSRFARVPNQGWWLTTETGSLDEPGTHYYYSHSFWCDVVPLDAIRQRIATHAEHPVASYQFENYTGIQFHPERSGANGLQFLRSILANHA